MVDQDVVCFHCGQPIGHPPVIHTVGGRPCPACAERLLESLPGVFHTPFAAVAAVAEVPESVRVEPGADYGDPDVESV